MNGFEFAVAHMPAVRSELGLLPMAVFMGIGNAPAQKDLEEATDLVLNLDRVAIGVRIRRRRYYHPDGSDLSIRFVCRGYRTEIHKLRDGFGDYYFMGFSENDRDALIDWWLLDLHGMRQENIFGDEHIQRNRWPVHPNYDGETAGLYIPLKELAPFTVARRDAFCRPPQRKAHARNIWGE